MAARGSHAKVIGIAGGIGAAVIIGIIVYGEMSKPPGGEILERPTVQWAVGNMLETNMTLKYRLSHISNNYQEIFVTFNFVEKSDDNWHVQLEVEDADGKVTQDMVLSRHLIPVGSVPEQFTSQMQMIQGSILWIVDYATTPKYLALGAVWGTITHGIQSQELKISAIEKVSTPAGTVDSYILSYTIKDKQSKLWIVEELPLPIKAEVYDEDGNLQFSFELVS
jgi:hypothetical protein